MKLIEVEPGRWRVSRETTPVARSPLPLPYVISDEIPPTEQVDGRFYTSKRQFRAVGRALGLTEVGNEKFKPKVRGTETREWKEGQERSWKKAVERYQAGHRPRRQNAQP
jgi:hypothetical protein